MRRNLMLLTMAAMIPLAYTGFSMANVTEAPDMSLNQSVLVGVQGPGNQGMVVAYGPDGDERWRVARAGSYHDVTRLDDGRVLVTYVEGSDVCGDYDAPCGRTGIRILDPQPSNETAVIDEQWSFAVRTVGNSELHDAEPLPNGDILAVDMDRERVLRVNLTTEQSTTVWNASEHYERPPDPTRTDWLHLNDVDRLPDGRIMVSVRNANEIVLLENGSVDEVINDGGDPTVIRGQHNPQWLGDGRVLVGDSSNDRVVELERQPNGSWLPVWSRDSATGLDMAWPRDADRLPNGHTLVTDSRNNRLIEFDENGAVVGTLQTPALPYEADVGTGERRGGLPAQESEAVPPGSGELDVPVVGRAWIGLQHTVPMPWWLTEWHLLTATPLLLLATYLFAAEVVRSAVEIGSVVRTRRRSTDANTEVTADDW